MPDQFTNIFDIACSESAANTLTFVKMSQGVDIFNKVGWVVSRLDYYIGSLVAAEFNGDADSLDWALCVSNSITTLNDLANPAILDFHRLQRIDFGTAAAAWYMIQPFVVDFSSLPGGGLIIPPSPLYLGVKGTGLVSANSVAVRGYFTQIELKADQYIELVEARRIIT